MKVIAALDNKPAAPTVAMAARSVAVLFGDSVEGLHVSENGSALAQASADSAGLELLLRRGRPLDQLVRALDDRDVALIVLGVRGTPGGRRPAGHRALELITRARKPVVVVPPDAREPNAIERMLVALDGTRASAEALAEAIKQVYAQDVEVVLLHVLGEDRLPRFADHVQHETRSWTDEFLARYCPEGVEPVTLEVRVGHAEECVLDVLREKGADLLALGWRQNLAAGRARVVREALARSPVPVLLVPADAHRSANSRQANNTRKD